MFSQNISVSPDKYSANCSTLIFIYHPGLVKYDVPSVLSLTPPQESKEINRMDFSQF
jgi:hypothetical protein